MESGVEERFIFLDKESGKDFNREQYKVLKNALRENVWKKLDVLFLLEIKFVLQKCIVNIQR